MSNIKIKGSSGGGSEYLSQIPQVQLNQNFGTDINRALSLIDENFKKMTSLPFLQGDHGNSIFEVSVNLGEGTLGSEVKKAICRAIYNGSETPNDTPFGGSNALGDSWDPATYDGTEIVFYRHKETSESGETYYYTARGLFIFIDCRIKNLGIANSQVPVSVLTSFVDLSCAVTVTASAPASESTGQPDLSNITVTAKKQSIVPTLYYNGSSFGSPGHWCWRVNGVETGVIAQGVQGSAGISKSVYICKGTKIPAPAEQHVNEIIKIEKILQPEQYSDIEENNIHGIISDGDLVVVWFKDEAYGDPYTDTLDNCTFGTAKNHSSLNQQDNVVSYTYIDNSTVNGQRLDLATIMADLSLFRWLNDINGDEPSTDPHNNPAVRGLYIPDGKMTADASDVHMLWSDGGKTASLGCVGIGNRQVLTASLPINTDGRVSNWPQDTSSLTLWYPTIRCHKSSAYRLLADTYTMTGGVRVNDMSSCNLKDFSGAGTNLVSLNLGRSEKVASAISLKGDLENDRDETLITSAGLFIKRAGDSYTEHAADIPSVYIDQGRYGKMYIKNGKITVEDGNVYIGSTNMSYNGPQTHFDAMYDGSDPSNSDGGMYTSLIEDAIRTQRWRMGPSVPVASFAPLVKNNGIKMVRSDAVIQNGTVIVSSDNAYKCLYLKDNKMLFDYKVHAEIGNASSGSLNNNTAVHDRRPRYKEYIGIQIGGYNTIYNSVTSNGSGGKTGRINTVLDNLRDPISLTPAQNKEYALLSGKSGYTAMIENWVADGVRAMDPSHKLDRDRYIQREDGDWGLITSYNCLWTKVGNVVDVKGKIFINKAKYTTDNNNILVETATAKPVSYAELFRHIKRYGTAWAFPLPVVVNSGTKTDPVYKVSTGNMMDNPSDAARIVNSPKIYDDSESDWYPKLGAASARKYHNDIFNGSAQFHFYGTTNEFTDYSAAVDSHGTNPAGLDGGMFMPEDIDVLNNVFTVTADISKSPTYDNRYWCMSGIPNYDVLNFRGPVSDSNDLATLNQFNMTEGSLGPVKIVAYETRESTITDHRDGAITDPVSPTVNARYRQSHAILGICDIPGNSTSIDWGNIKPTNFNKKAGKLDIKYNNFPPVDIGTYLKDNFMENLRSYKVSVNIGPYMVRYISFSFSYLLDDDVQEAFQGKDRAGYIGSVDADKWVIPTNVEEYKESGWDTRRQQF